MRSIRQLTNSLTRPAPMNEFGDYDDYWRRRGQLDTILERWRYATQRIPDGATVLDIGSGSGEFLKYLRATRPSVRATAADFSDEALRRAERLGFEAIRLDLSSQPIQQKFDFVTCFEVLEHIANAEEAIIRLRSAFVKGLFISIPNVAYIQNRIRLGFFGRFPLTNCVFHIKEHVRHWSPQDFREWSEHYGLVVTDEAGQYGVGPWRRWPRLFASGMVYYIQH